MWNSKVFVNILIAFSPSQKHVFDSIKSSLISGSAQLKWYKLETDEIEAFHWIEKLQKGW